MLSSSLGRRYLQEDISKGLLSAVNHFLAQELIISLTTAKQLSLCHAQTEPSSSTTSANLGHTSSEHSIVRQSHALEFMRKKAPPISALHSSRTECKRGGLCMTLGNLPHLLTLRYPARNWPGAGWGRFPTSSLSPLSREKE